MNNIVYSSLSLVRFVYIHLLLGTLIFCLFSCTIAFAQVPSGLHAATPEIEILDLDLPAYLGTTVIPLSKKEKQALQLSTTWVTRSTDAFLVGNGKLVYVYGSSMPTVLASPMQVCDVELQEGNLSMKSWWVIVQDGLSKQDNQTILHTFL